MIFTCRMVGALFVLMASTAAAGAQPVAEPAALRGESPQTRKRLAEAEHKLLDGKAAEAVEELQRILDEAGDDLINLDGRHHRPARWVAHQILAKLPAEALKTYRDRIDEPARKLLEAGKRDRDPRPLWLLLDRYFVSRSGEAASLLLGDLLFERGDFRTAEIVWKRLIPDGEADLNYPGSKADPAAVQARLCLAAIFQGEMDRARTGLAAIRAKHPEASGNFAGKNGKYAETLQAFLDHPPPSTSVAVNDRTWPTFGGDPGRSGRIHGAIPIRWPTRPTWTAAVPPAALGPNAPPVHPPLGHPVILNGRVYVCDGNRLFSFDLATGFQKRVYPPPLIDLNERKPGLKPTDVFACPTLTAAHDRLYARVGAPVLRPPEPAKPGATEVSEIVCFVPVDRSSPNLAPVRELWRIRPPSVEGRAPAIWEGAPLAAHGRLWAAFARFESGRAVHAIACYDPADADDAPERPAWVAEVCDSALLADPANQPRARQELLTLAGRNVVFCSNTGVVVALDAAAGHRAWAMQYPRAARLLVDANRSPDPAPAVCVGGRVFAAPADADRVFAFDSETGQQLWESGRTEGARILGLARGRLIVTVAGPVRGIRGLNAATGSYRDDGWIQSTGLLSYGQGAVSDDVIIWPSRNGLYILDPGTGYPLVDPIGFGSPVGNVAFADGWMVVVTPTQVKGYRAAGPPFARPATPQARFGAAVDGAEREAANGDRDLARKTLAAAARDDFPKPWRAWAAARWLSLGTSPEDARDLPPELLGEWLVSADGELLMLGTLAARRLGKPAPALGAPSKNKPRDMPIVDADIRVAAATLLPVGSIPLQPIAGSTVGRRVYIATPRELLAISFGGAAEKRYPWAGEYTYAADLSDGFIAAGPRLVAVYSRQAGEFPWVFRVPELDPLPGRRLGTSARTDDSFALPELSSFVLAGNWLFARLGEHHLIAFDLESRRVAWVLGAHGQPRYQPHLFPSTPSFTPQFFVSERLLGVQLSDGRRWLVQASTGRVWNEIGSTFKSVVPAGFGAKTTPVAWTAPPVEVEGGRITFPDGPGLLQFASAATGQPKFCYDADGESSLSGEPIQARRWGDMLLAAVRRNYGVELDRVDPLDGKSAWSGGAMFLDAARIDLTAADADSQRLYLPIGNKLHGITLDDGKAAWEVKLPAEARWIVRAGTKVVIVYPAEAIPDEPFDAAFFLLSGSFQRSPQPWRLPWLAAALYDAWVDRTVPVLFFDPETGKLLKLLRLPARGPNVAAWFDGDRIVMATGDRVCVLK
jgi:outer membrane protein assembly factor BamB